jgi:DNA adenine methylase
MQKPLRIAYDSSVMKNDHAINSAIPKPFLRWAGGKNWLVKHLPEFVPEHFHNYHEPFLGAGSVFLAINPREKSFLSDLNPELIATYVTLRTSVDGIIGELSQYKNTEDFYYWIRDQQFDDPVQKASRFVFLNQTSFNGIYRVSLKGRYNVPYGHRTTRFLNENALRVMSDRLRSAELFSGDFTKARHNIEADDLVFLDPPYVVSHNSNGFIKYNQRLFSLDDQNRLSILIDFIRSKGAFYIMTNAAHQKIVEIFDKNDRIVALQRVNSIGGLKAERGHTTEYLFTNVR